MNRKANIAVIGAGIAGSTAALYLSKLGLNVTLFEKNTSIVSGPPFCHLHAGGNLYREISDQQCITLLHQSIDLLKFYPYGVDFRPTLIVTPTTDDQDPNDLLPRLKLLQKEYEDSIQADRSNEVLGNPKEYYKLYTKEDILNLKNKNISDQPTTLDDWIIPVLHHVNLDKLKYPLIMVQEYGLNLFRVGAGISLQLQDIPNCQLLLNTHVKLVQAVQDRYEVTFSHNNTTSKQTFDFLINACGYLTGKIDDMLGFKRKRFVEFKAAYVTKWENDTPYWPEIIFHGKRGTPQGMAQFTPYPNGYFQLHGMTKDITLFENGLVANTPHSSQPILETHFEQKLDHNWNNMEIYNRTIKAIQHLEQFLPTFKNAKVASKPLYGAQQIPGIDKDLRAADVTFENNSYARCEIVKASSVLTMCDEIVKKLILLGYIDEKDLYKRDLNLKKLKDEDILQTAIKICQLRSYPTSLADLLISKKD